MKKKLLSALLAATMAIGTFSGLGNSIQAAAAEIDTSEEVNLVMYIIGDRPSGQDVADEYLNELLKERLNCTLEVRWLPWSDYTNKYPLLFSSGEEFDMAYAATWLNFYGMAQKGAYMCLDDLWETYAPQNFALQTEEAKKQATINGHYYAIPTLWGELNAFGPLYRADLAADSEWDGKMENFDDMEEYLDVIREKYPEMEPIDIYSAGSELDYVYFKNQGYLSLQTSSADFLYYDPSEENPQLKCYYEMEEVEDFLNMMARWNEKGFFTKSALADTDSVKFTSGKSALKVHNLEQFKDCAIQRPEWDIAYSNMVEKMSHSMYTRNCLVLPNTCQNVERSLAFWDLLTTDREVYDAFYYGVLGTTYELDDNGNYAVTDNNLYAISNMWAARRPEFIRNAIGTPDAYNELSIELEEKIKTDNSAERYAGFVADMTNVETEYAACQNVMQQYWWPLELGYTNVEEGLADFQKKMEAAGIEKVKEELQAQLDAYTANLE